MRQSLFMTRAALLIVFVVLAGCRAPEACESERLPNRGVADSPATLATIAKHGMANDCSGVVRDVSRQKTRAEYGRLKFWAAVDKDLSTLDREFDEGTTLRKILLEGEFAYDYEGRGCLPGE